MSSQKIGADLIQNEEIIQVIFSDADNETCRQVPIEMVLDFDSFGKILGIEIINLKYNRTRHANQSTHDAKKIGAGVASRPVNQVKIRPTIRLNIPQLARLGLFSRSTQGRCLADSVSIQRVHCRLR
jgi:hypothetical protein